jgi:hypothetical protein
MNWCGTHRPLAHWFIGLNLVRSGATYPAGGSLKEALMTEWRDDMVDRPDNDEGAYAAGWTVSGLAVLGAIVALWVFGI